MKITMNNILEKLEYIATLDEYGIPSYVNKSFTVKDIKNFITKMNGNNIFKTCNLSENTWNLLLSSDQYLQTVLAFVHTNNLMCDKMYLLSKITDTLVDNMQANAEQSLKVLTKLLSHYSYIQDITNQKSNIIKYLVHYCLIDIDFQIRNLEIFKENILAGWYPLATEHLTYLFKIRLYAIFGNFTYKLHDEVCNLQEETYINLLETLSEDDIILNEPILPIQLKLTDGIPSKEMFEQLHYIKNKLGNLYKNFLSIWIDLSFSQKVIADFIIYLERNNSTDVLVDVPTFLKELYQVDWIPSNIQKSKEKFIAYVVVHQKDYLLTLIKENLQKIQQASATSAMFQPSLYLKQLNLDEITSQEKFNILVDTYTGEQLRQIIASQLTLSFETFTYFIQHKVVIFQLFVKLKECSYSYALEQIKDFVSFCPEQVLQTIDKNKIETLSLHLSNKALKVIVQEYLDMFPYLSHKSIMNLIIQGILCTDNLLDDIHSDADVTLILHCLENDNITKDTPFTFLRSHLNEYYPLWCKFRDALSLQKTIASYTNIREKLYTLCGIQGFHEFMQFAVIENYPERQYIADFILMLLNGDFKNIKCSVQGTQNEIGVDSSCVIPIIKNGKTFEFHDRYYFEFDTTFETSFSFIVEANLMRSYVTRNLIYILFNRSVGIIKLYDNGILLSSMCYTLCATCDKDPFCYDEPLAVPQITLMPLFINSTEKLNEEQLKHWLSQIADVLQIPILYKHSLVELGQAKEFYVHNIPLTLLHGQKHMSLSNNRVENYIGSSYSTINGYLIGGDSTV